MNDTERLLQSTPLPEVRAPYFMQRLRVSLTDAVRWRQRSYVGAFAGAASAAALLLIAATTFVVRPETAGQLRVALGGKPVVETPAAVTSETAVAVAPTPRPAASRPPFVANTVTIPRIEMVPSGDPDAELVRRIAAATSESDTVDARPVGSVQVREYELSNGQRIMVLDRVQPRERTTRKAQPAVYY